MIRTEFWNINLPVITRMGWNTNSGRKETREEIKVLIFKIGIKSWGRQTFYVRVQMVNIFAFGCYLVSAVCKQS